MTSTTTYSKSKGRKALALAILSIVAWLSIGGFSGQAFSKISTVQKNDNAAFLPEKAESTIAQKTIVKFSAQSADLLPALLLLALHSACGQSAIAVSGNGLCETSDSLLS